MMALRDSIAQNSPLALTLGGLVIGSLFGAIVYRMNFCTMGSISDMVAMGDYRRFRAWLLAIAIAIVGAQWLQHGGVVQLSKSMYLAPNVNWLGHIAGGLMFGFGMVFAGGCPSRNLARVGGGDLRSLITLIVLGIFAYMTIGGLLGPPRAWLEQATAVSVSELGATTQGLDDLVGALFTITPFAGRLTVSTVAVGAIVAYCLADRRFRASPIHILSGLGVGLCVVAGWALTGLAFDELSVKPVAPISLTFVRPTGDALEWLQRFTALGWPGFGVASVFGAVLGAFVVAQAMGRFRITTFSDRGDTIRMLMGASLMGVGGVMALGCTIGQGITGLSTLAIGSFLAFAGIVTGGVCGVKVFERMFLPKALTEPRK
jgi:uncharacterized membrane protein YedE/YeeE